MPPDTSYIPENLQKHLDSLGESYLKAKEEGSRLLAPEWVLFSIVFGILLLSIYFYIIKPALREKRNRMFKYRLSHPDHSTREKKYDGWLSEHNKYYAALSPEQKKRFLERTICFLEAKEFRFHEIAEEEYIPVLVSGAAVQMSLV